MKRRFDLIIFDWDGTLMDSVDWIVCCIQSAAEYHACPVPDVQATKDIVGLSLDAAMKVLFPEASQETRTKLSLHYGQMFFSRPISRNDLFPGVYDMLQRLRQDGYRLAVATGKKASGLARALEGTGTADLFCATRCADQTASKPDPLMIDEIVAELAISKHRILMVGDSAHDLQMALNAGVAAIGVTCGAHSAEVLQQYRPLCCLNNPVELQNIL